MVKPLEKLQNFNNLYALQRWWLVTKYGSITKKMSNVFRGDLALSCFPIILTNQKFVFFYLVNKKCFAADFKHVHAIGVLKNFVKHLSRRLCLNKAAAPQFTMLLKK